MAWPEITVVTPLIFILGTLLGSFLNVVILRYIKHKAASSTRAVEPARSYCPECQQTLRWWELVPLLSFILLRGRCQRCGAAISLQYPLVEFAMGVAAVVIFSSFPSTITSMVASLVTLGIVACLLVLAFVDRATFLLPDQYLIVLSVFCVTLILLQPTLLPWDIVGGIVIGAGFLFSLWLITRGQGIGLGDIKLLIPLGALFGVTATVMVLFLAFTIGGLVGIALLTRGHSTMKTAIPFGPFLAGAAILVLLVPQLPTRFFLLLWGV
ncbi:MAG: prepilin peptidase [Candidatus Andersenbacteria bacterium]